MNIKNRMFAEVAACSDHHFHSYFTFLLAVIFGYFLVILWMEKVLDDGLRFLAQLFVVEGRLLRMG
ncbi:hypothetical protein Peur_064564 [Populus x canadensis]